MDRQFQEIDGKRHVKVRVPVIVDADGRWVACSDDTRNKQEASGELAGTADGLAYDHIRRMYWLYALVPVPDHDKYAVIGCEPQCD